MRQRSGSGPREAKEIPTTIGDYLVWQLSQEDKAIVEKGFDSVVEIAKKLDVEKQMDFISLLSGWLDVNDSLAALQKIYETYSVKHATKQYTRKKIDLYRQVDKARSQPRIKSDALLKDLKSRLENLEKQHAKEKAPLKKALEEFYTLLKSKLAPGRTQLDWATPLEKLFNPPENYSKDSIRPPQSIPGQSGSFYRAPLLNVRGSNPQNPNNPGKLDLRQQFEEEPGIEQGLFMSLKEGGANDPGQYGARYIRCYLDPTGKVHSQIVFCKQATDNCLPNHRENIAEVLTGRLMNRMIGDIAASTYFALKPQGKRGTPDDVYVASIYFDDMTDLHTAANKKAILARKLEKFQEEKHRAPTSIELEKIKRKLKIPKRGKGPGGGQDIQSKPRTLPGKKGNFGGTPSFQPGCLALEESKELDLTSLGKALTASLLCGNYQIHSENVALASYPGDREGALKRLAAIFDFGGGFRRPYSTKLFGAVTEELPGRFKRGVHPERSKNLKYETSYFMAYPEKQRRSKAFIDGIDAVVNGDNHSLLQELSASIDEAVKFYGEQGFMENFAHELDTVHELKTVDETKDFLADTLLARKLSLQEFSLQSKLENIKGNGKRVEYRVLDLIKEHPIYFLLNRPGTVAAADPIWYEIPTILHHFFPAPLLAPLINLLGEKIGLNRDLNRNNVSAMDRKQIIKGFINQLRLVVNYLDGLGETRPGLTILSEEAELLSNYLENASSTYNLESNPDDQSILIQACDRAFNLLRKTYESVPQKDALLAALSRPIESLPPTRILAEEKSSKSAIFFIPSKKDKRPAPLEAGIFSELGKKGKSELEKLTDLTNKPQNLGMLGRIFDESPPTNKEIVWASGLLKDCKADAFGRNFNGKNLDYLQAIIDKVVTALGQQRKPNEEDKEDKKDKKLVPFMVQNNKLAPWLHDSLPTEIREPITHYLTQFYKKIHEATFDAANNLQPWISKLLGEERLATMIEYTSEIEVKSQIYAAIRGATQATLMQVIRYYASDSPEQESVLNFMRLVGALTGPIQSEAAELESRKIELSTKRHPEYREKKLEDACSPEERDRIRSLIFTTYPLTDLSTLSAEITQQRKEVFAARNFYLEQNAIVNEKSVAVASRHTALSRPTVFANAAPAVALTTHQAQIRAGASTQEHQLTFSKKNGETIHALIEERINHQGNIPTSDITRLDGNLDIVKLLAKTAFLLRKLSPTEEIAEFSDETKARRFFADAIKQFRKQPGTIDLEAIHEYLRNQLSIDLNNEELLTISKALFKNYKLATEQLDPYDGSQVQLDPYSEATKHFPSDAFIRLARQHVESFLALCDDDKAELVINADCWDPHYVEAVILYCHAKNYTPPVYEGQDCWKIEMSDEKKEAFKAFYEKRFKELDLKCPLSYHPPEPAASTPSPRLRGG